MSGYLTQNSALPEILAPVGGQEQLVAAVRCGADAVYMGAKGFNARGNAENFSADGLRDAVRYCHARGVKVHVTLNTLIRDDERAAFEDTLAEVAEAGADAVIVQDLGAAEIIRSRCPSLPMHASTQMAIHNAAGAMEMEALGFARVVLARELSLCEIRAIRERTSAELEAFIHGALCMSVSGACYLSSMIGGRSGNRGRCAQPCRLNFTCRRGEYALSLKDMSHISRIGELTQAGVCSFKIEGRMKRPEYVAASVTACRAAREGRPYDAEALRAVFSRSGFTGEYLAGISPTRTADMFGTRTRDDVSAGGAVLGSFARLYEKEPQAVAADMRLTLRPGEPVRLTASDGLTGVTVSGEAPLPSDHPADPARLAGQLARTGGTIFRPGRVEADCAGDVFLPSSAVNALRREALDALYQARANTPPHPLLPSAPQTEAPHTPAEHAALRLRAERSSQLTAIDVPAERYILPLSELESHPEAFDIYGDRLCAELPALVWPGDEERTCRSLLRLKARGLKHSLAENAGAVRMARDASVSVSGGAGLNAFNTPAIEKYAAMGLADITLSFELALSHARRLGGALPRGIIAAGRLPLMRLRACPLRMPKTGCALCGGCGELTDRLGKRFPVLCSGRRYSTLLNCVPLYLGDKGALPFDFVTLQFTTEQPEECARLTRMFAAGAAPDFERTGGLYYRSVE